eukprot:SAG31_NODE_9_length_42330_cov_441.979162_17_plen_104_part_00
MQASGKMKHFHGGGGGTEQLQSNGVDVLTVPTTIRSRTERRKSWLARYKCALMTSVLTVILVRARLSLRNFWVPGSTFLTKSHFVGRTKRQRPINQLDGVGPV